MANEVASSGLLSTLKQKAREWAQTVVNLKNTPVSPKMQPKKDALMARAKWIKEKIEAVWPEFTSGMDLGFLPLLIPAIAATAIIAEIGIFYVQYKNFIADAAAENKREAIYTDLTKNQGVSPSEAARVANQIAPGESSSGGFFSNFGTNLGTGLGGVAGLAIAGLVIYYFMSRSKR